MISSKKINLKIEKVLENEKIIFQNEKKIINKENIIQGLEFKTSENKKDQFENSNKLTNQFRNIEKKLETNDYLQKISIKDISKSFIGSITAVLSAFAFISAAPIINSLNLIQISFLYLVSIIIIIIMVYHTGFKRIKKNFKLIFLTEKILIIYLISIFSIFLVHIIFGLIKLPVNLLEIYKIIGVNLIPAVIGGVIADLTK